MSAILASTLRALRLTPARAKIASCDFCEPARVPRRVLSSPSTTPNATFFKPVESVIISSFQATPPYRCKDFLFRKYVAEKLSVAEISALIFSARSTVTKHLELFGIPLRKTQMVKKRPGYRLAYGKRIVNRQEILHKREQANIQKMRELRAQGFSYWKIAEIFNSMKIPTQTGKGKWHAKTIQQILKPKRKKH